MDGIRGRQEAAGQLRAKTNAGYLAPDDYIIRYRVFYHVTRLFPYLSTVKSFFQSSFRRQHITLTTSVCMHVVAFLLLVQPMLLNERILIYSPSAIKNSNYGYKYRGPCCSSRAIESTKNSTSSNCNKHL